MILKAKYLKRWRGSGGKYRYQYAEGTPKESATDIAEQAFVSATEKMGWASGVLVDYLEGKFGITSFADLKKQIKANPNSRASEIYAAVKEYIDKTTLPTGAKGELLHRLGRTLIHLKTHYAPAKVQLTVRVEKPGKSTRWVKKTPSAAFPPTKVRAAKVKLGTWTDMTTLPTATQIKQLKTNKLAVVVSGKPTAKKKWEVRQKQEHIVIPFRENEKGIKVQLRQSAKRQQRTTTTAIVELTIPYPYARQFLKHHITSTRTRNDLIGQMERSKGFKKTLGVA